jgi:hypothetical protein
LEELVSDEAALEEPVYPFSLEAGAPPKDVALALEEFGVAHIEAFLAPRIVDSLSEETDRLFDDRSQWVHPERYSVGKSVRIVRKEMDTDGYPTIAETFADAWLESVVAESYGDGYVYGEQIYGILDGVGQQHIVQELHYDKVQHIKIFFYLSDVDLDHGPFHCVPGSHRHCAALQEENRKNRRIPTDEQVRILPESFADEAMPVTGPRGTLIIFNSDIAHRACAPTAGPRLAIRSLNWGPRSLGERI